MSPCPLCGSPGVLDPGDGVQTRDMASCSNGSCYLHIGYQDDTNRHVSLEEWEFCRKADQA